MSTVMTRVRAFILLRMVAYEKMSCLQDSIQQVCKCDLKLTGIDLDSWKWIVVNCISCCHAVHKESGMGVSGFKSANNRWRTRAQQKQLTQVFDWYSNFVYKPMKKKKNSCKNWIAEPLQMLQLLTVQGVTNTTNLFSPPTAGLMSSQRVSFFILMAYQPVLFNAKAILVEEQ